MPKRFLDRYLPSAQSIREHPALRPISRWLHAPDLWHLNRRSVSGAMLIGLFCAFLPIPFQMLLAGALGVAARCNLAVCVLLTWITNPFTTPPVLFFAYQVGAWILNRHVEISTIVFDWQWLSANMGNIGYPVLVGSLVCGSTVGLIGYGAVRVGWRLHIRSRWRLRRDGRRLRKLLEQQHPGGR